MAESDRSKWSNVRSCALLSLIVVGAFGGCLLLTSATRPRENAQRQSYLTAWALCGLRPAWAGGRATTRPARRVATTCVSSADVKTTSAE